MSQIDKNDATNKKEVREFLNNVFFLLPDGFIEFYRGANGADISSDELYTILWSLTDLFQLNKGYDVDEYAPGFFIFGSDGGDIAFTIEKATGKIFEMPFIGMSSEEAVFLFDSFDEFLQSR